MNRPKSQPCGPLHTSHVARTAKDNLMTQVTKICNECGKELPATAEYFHQNKSKKSGFSEYCKQCKAEKDRLYREKNKDTISKRKKSVYKEKYETIKQRVARYFSTNKEKVYDYKRKWNKKNKNRKLEYDRRYREKNEETERIRKAKYVVENKEKVIQSQRKYREANKEKDRAYAKIWRARNPEKVRARSERRRAAKRGAEGAHTAEDIKQQYARQGGRCHWCSRKVGKKFHVDHIVPLSRGGSNSPENLVISCPKCNLSKGAKLPHEWPEGGRLL